MDGEKARPVIVAGVDGSEDSKEALRWAVRQARLTGAEVHAVIAWEVPVTVFFVPSYTDSGRVYSYPVPPGAVSRGCQHLAGRLRRRGA